MGNATTGGPAAALINNTVLDQLDSRDPGIQKEAADTINDYVRIKMREDGFLRRILPPVTMTNDELDRQVDTDLPVKVVDKEPNSPGAISVPFASLPQNRYIYGPRFRVMFDRILTPQFMKDVDALRTYDMDIRQIISDNSIKDLLAEEDGKWITVVNALLIAPGTVIPETGAAQWLEISGGVTRENLFEALKTLPRTSRHLNVATVLINNVTIFDIAKFTRNEVGGDLSENMFRTGFTEEKLLGVRFIITIKRDLVPDGTIFLFADPKFMGKFYVLEDTTMFIERKAFMLKFFAYESIGAAIANVAAIGRVDFVS